MELSAETEPLFDPDQLALLHEALGEEELRAMLSQLPEAATGSLDAIKAAIAATDADEARRAAHVLKGFSSSLGAQRLSSVAREIELELATIDDIAGRMPALMAAIEATVEELPRVAIGP